MVTCTGRMGQAARTLRVQLEPDTEGFSALSSEGRFLAHNSVYVNGLSSPQDPRRRPGNLHFAFNGIEDAIWGSGSSHLRASGDITATGTIDSVDLQTTSRSQQDGQTKPQYFINKDALIDGKTFTPTSSSNAGVYDGNHRFSGDVTFPTKVTITKGSTVHIKGGNAKFLAGVEGEGSLVVDGNVVIQTDGDFDPNNKTGVTLVADGAVTVKHPEAQTDGQNVDYDVNVVGDYFARMPEAAFTEIARNTPESAPRDGDFFDWFSTSVGGADPTFELWYDGNGTEQYPGLSESTKQWLSESGPIKEDIKAWVDSASE